MKINEYINSNIQDENLIKITLMCILVNKLTTLTKDDSLVFYTQNNSLDLNKHTINDNNLNSNKECVKNDHLNSKETTVALDKTKRKLYPLLRNPISIELENTPSNNNNTNSINKETHHSLCDDLITPTKSSSSNTSKIFNKKDIKQNLTKSLLRKNINNNIPKNENIKQSIFKNTKNKDIKQNISKIICNKDIDPSTCKNDRKISSNIPVILSENNLYISLNSSIKFEDNILEIKNITNHVYIIDATLLDTSPINELTKKNIGRIFLKGILKQDIHYSTLDNNCTKGNITGFLKHTINYIPFDRVTITNFNTAPILLKNNAPISIVDSTNTYKNDSVLRKNSVCTKNTNNQICCNLKKVSINDHVDYTNISKLTITPIPEFLFDTLNQNIFLKLNLLFTQKQLVNI